MFILCGNKRILIGFAPLTRPWAARRPIKALDATVTHAVVRESTYSVGGWPGADARYGAKGVAERFLWNVPSAATPAELVRVSCTRAKWNLRVATNAARGRFESE